jgi:phosphatidylinositol alpha-1,6-mannosyltransferase
MKGVLRDDSGEPGKWWFVVRKYPPAIGGMELLSFNVISRLSARHPVEVLPMRMPAWMLPWFIVTSAVRLARACVKGHTALLHIGDPVLAPLALVARLFGIPCSVTIHGLDIVYDRGFYPLWRKLFLRGFDAYICISEATRLAALRLQIPRDRIHVIGAGIDIMEQPSGPVARDPTVILFVGRLVRRKGVAWFVAEVLPALATRHPDVKLVVLGDGPERRAIAASATAHGVGDRIVWLGARGDDEKASWFATAAVCVMPNIAVAGDMEGFGIVALEAAAAGCPVVAADLEGLRDAITNGQSGTLVPSEDASAWVRAVEALLVDRRLNAEFGTKARDHVRRMRGWTPIVDAYFNVLSETAQKGGGKISPT